MSQSNKLFKRTYTALVTPFKDQEVDYKSLEKVVQSQVEAEVEGLIINGTSAESPTLDGKEVEAIFHHVKQLVPKGVQLILGVGTNNTATTIDWVRKANQWQADGALAVVPYYNKPPQRALVQHFKMVASKSEVPIILYNVPGRTIQSLSAESVGELSQHNMIYGIKEASGDLNVLSEIKKNVGEEFCLLSGDDDSAIDFCLQGGDGVIGVVSHLIPKQIVELIDRAMAGDTNASKDYVLWKGLLTEAYSEVNPIPMKMGLYLMNIIKSPELRLPLVELAEENSKRLKQCLQNHKLI